MLNSETNGSMVNGAYVMPEPEKSKVTQADRNTAKKMKSVRGLQQLLQLALDPEFCGFVGVRVHAKGGKLGKIVKFFEDHDTDD